MVPAHWHTQRHVHRYMFQSRVQMFCNAFSIRPTANYFHWIKSKICSFVSKCFTSYISYFQYVWLAHFINMQEVARESQENTEILRHKAHVPLLHKYADGTCTPKQCTNNYFSCSSSYRSIKQL